VGRLDRLAGSLSRTEGELRREQAAALTRIALKLESLLGRLRTVQAEIGTLSGDARARRLAEYAELRSEATLYRWYLEVQREAVGLVHHGRLDELYPMPPAVDS
jgi:hypothetical protein